MQLESTEALTDGICKALGAVRATESSASAVGRRVQSALTRRYRRVKCYACSLVNGLFETTTGLSCPTRSRRLAHLIQ